MQARVLTMPPRSLIKNITLWITLLFVALLGGAFCASQQAPLIYFTLGLVIICAVTDLVKGLVYNVIVLPAIVFALGYHLAVAGYPGLLFWIKGIFIAGSLAYFIYWFCGVGGGDFKLILALGVLHGGYFSAFVVFMASLLGGVYAVVLMLRRGELGEYMKATVNTSRYIAARVGFGNNSKVEEWELPDYGSLPFAVPMALSVVVYYILNF